MKISPELLWRVGSAVAGALLAGGTVQGFHSTSDPVPQKIVQITPNCPAVSCPACPDVYIGKERIR